jgi:serine/threonine protein kinase
MLDNLSIGDGVKINQDYVDIFSGDSDELSLEKLNYSNIANQISGRYEISSEQYHEFSNDFVRAYKVVDLADSGRSDDLYAIAFNKDMPFRLFEIMKLSRASSEHAIIPLDYGVTQLGVSEEQVFIAIMRKPKGKTLKQMVEEGYRLEKNYLYNQFLPQILKAINDIHQAEIIHGLINPENIYIHNDQVILGECVSELCGYSQPTFFETLDRAQCLPLGKATGLPSTDFYALGMVVFYGISGRNFTGTSDQDLIRQKLFQGTYHFLNAAFLLNGKTGDLIRGLATDQADVRWSASDVDTLVRGKEYTLSNLTDLSYLSRAIVFNGKEHYSRKSLAYDLSVNWLQAKEFIKTDKIRKWLESSSSEEKYTEAIELLQSSYIPKSVTKKIVSDEDESLMKMLIAIDPEGPIRCKDLVFFKEGIGPLLAHSISSSHTETTKVLASLLFMNVFDIYEVLATLYAKNSIRANLNHIKRAGEFLRKSEYGFG